MYGDSLKDYVVMIGVLNMDTVDKYVKSINNSKVQANETLCNSPDFIATVYLDMMVAADRNKLNSLERPKQLRLILDPFTIENDLLTPTMKLKRHEAKKHYQSLIDKMYNEPVLDPRKLKETRAAAPAESKKTK